MPIRRCCKARAFKFFFLGTEALDFLFAFFQVLLQAFDLLLQLAHLAFGFLQVFLHAGFVLLQLLQQLFQLGHVAARGFQLFLGVGFLVGKRRSQQAGEENQGKEAKHGTGDTWAGDGPSMPKNPAASCKMRWLAGGVVRVTLLCC